MEPSADPDDALGTRSANLAALEERKREVKSKLRAVANSLRDAGAVTSGYDSAYYLEPAPTDFPSATIHDRLFRCRRTPVSHAQRQREATVHFDFDPPDAVCIEWTLSALGREKCETVFARFDLDDDGAWSYGEFLEYLAALEQERERPDIRAFADDPEVWQMYMSDLFDTDAHFRLTLAGFMMYREAIEHDTPLERDLRVLRIPIEWRGLEKMREYSRLFDAYVDAEGGVELRTALYLFAESGHALPLQELCETVQRQRFFARCLKSVLNCKRSLRLFGYRQKSTLLYTNPQLEDEPKICKAAFLSLMLSSWTPAPKTLHLRSFTVLRRWQRSVSWTFDNIRKVARTGLLRASCLLSTTQRERGDYVLKMDVGSRFSSHATVHVSYNSDADSASTLHELKYLERGAECFVYVDLTCRSGAKDNDILWISQKLTWFLHEYFRDHFESLPCFHKWFVTIPTKLQLRSGSGGLSGGGGFSSSSSSASSSTVIRIVILFSGEMDLYQVMQSLHLPSSMQFDHLLQRFSFRLLCSHSLEEILSSKRLDFGSQWACRLQLDARLNKQALAQILSQLAKKLETDAVQEAEELAFLTQEKAKKMQTESQQQQQQQQAAKRANSTVGLPSDADNQDHLHKTAEDNARDLKLDTLASVRMWLQKASEVLGFSQEVSATFSFASVNDMLLGNRWMASVLPPKLFKHVKHLVTTHGGIASEWKSGCDSFRMEFGAPHSAPQGITTARRALSRASSRSSTAAHGSEDSSGLEHSIAASFPFATPVSTSESHKRPGTVAAAASRSETVLSTTGSDAKDAHSSEKKQRELKKEEVQENELLELYDMCSKHLMGVSVVRAEAGTSGLTCVLEGWSFFSLLPRAQVQSGRRKSLVRIKSSTSTTSNSGSVAGLGSRNR